MNVFAALTCFSVCVAVCTAHMCLIEPKQRGSMMNLNKAGSDDCILLKAPCGDRPAGLAQTVLKSGGNFSVVFQKNLDHWAEATPGFFSVVLLQGPSTPKELARVKDMGEKSLTLYTVNGVLPTVDTGDYILQVIYVTMNSQAPPYFYQCADVYIQ